MLSKYSNIGSIWIIPLDRNCHIPMNNPLFCLVYWKGITVERGQEFKVFLTEEQISPFFFYVSFFRDRAIPSSPRITLLTHRENDFLSRKQKNMINLILWNINNWGGSHLHFLKSFLFPYTTLSISPFCPLNTISEQYLAPLKSIPRIWLFPVALL